MIVLTHKYNSVVSVFNDEDNSVINIVATKPTEALFQLATKYQNNLIAWCHDDLKSFIHYEGFKKIFNHKLVMASFEIRNHNYISKRIGYVESSPFVNIKKNVTYPTWLMSPCIGGIQAQVLLKYNLKDYKKYPFAYTLNAIAKKGMASGLFCYSSPALLHPNTVVLPPYKASDTTLYQFIKQHYKMRWLFLTFFNTALYEKKLQVFSLLRSLFISKKTVVLDFTDIKVSTNKSTPSMKSIDVVIPTMGRKPYLYDVLQDLSQQTLLPKQVIIVEQNPDVKSKSDLDYLSTQTWPFHIDHVFIHQTGACNARNVALKRVSSDYVFMADDDIRFQPELIENTLKTLFQFGLEAVTLSCLKEGEQENKKQPLQWQTFGSGCSIVLSDVLDKVTYDMAFEHGFGEDGDFGMQLRNLGVDIIYLPNCRLLHLKAPIGGFRTPFAHPWENDDIQPKPSPTIMLYQLKHQSKFQIMSYKTMLFFKFYQLQPYKNIFSYIPLMKKRWIKSVYWANQLKINDQ
ncbi:MAG: glycosyltransferase family A protein [Gelidibacter sp.]